MNRKSMVYILILWVLGTFISCLSGWAQNKPENKPPVIINTFAAEKGRYGHIWKIYIEAEDPDGDMQKMAAAVEQVGYGRYPTDFVILKTPFQKHLKGYVQWNTYSSKAGYLREWTQITLTISIFDKAGNESNEVIFPFTFETGGGREPKPPPPFDQKDIPKVGNLHIELVEPTMREPRDRRLEK
jgi:hypothetical protein